MPEYTLENTWSLACDAQSGVDTKAAPSTDELEDSPKGLPLKPTVPSLTPKNVIWLPVYKALDAEIDGLTVRGTRR